MNTFLVLDLSTEKGIFTNSLAHAQKMAQDGKMGTNCKILSIEISKGIEYDLSNLEQFVINCSQIIDIVE